MTDFRELVAPLHCSAFQTTSVRLDAGRVFECSLLVNHMTKLTDYVYLCCSLSLNN